MSLYPIDRGDIPSDVREDMERERAERRYPHWCEDCHGHTGPGSPCYVEPETEAEEQEADHA